MTEEINHCPVCGASSFTDFLTSKDYFLTGESFTIKACKTCGFRFTNPVPAQNEIGKYYNSEEYISHDSKKNDLISLMYRAARWFAVRNKYSIIESFTKGKTLLDIGCGTGELLRFCSQRGFQVKGVEPNNKAREFAKLENKIDVAADLKEESLRGAKFDCITLWHVLEHLPQPGESVKQISRMLNPGGVLIIAVPNSDSWDAGKYQNYWAAYDLPRHLSHFTFSTLKYFMERNNYKLVKCIPQKLDAFYISLLSEKYKTGRTNFLKAFVRGIQSNYYGAKQKMNHSSIIFILTPEIAYF